MKSGFECGRITERLPTWLVKCMEVAGAHSVEETLNGCIQTRRGLFVGLVHVEPESKALR